MRTLENDCVGCPSDLGCIGDSCPYRNVERFYCDECSSDASYRIDGLDLCDECAENYIKNAFEDLALWEKAKILNISFDELGG